ncbi:CRP/FNR family transcriptional regulator [Paenibacillus phyllosphaerae]|uniref:CRP/FNR family transcriptional regulator n=1 Tax=Paenibacillus phyllosphaerae TaxID=274593 RepID=A0A7W5B2C9_9BACL|nr:Crp/Fnr family transcriptional regulator [Paenibacillus phyllosphaerae]MBB3112899.1 CRP/FNR family transcriptional regulator [Paenibacillus phyllosphaerae]
MVMFANLIKNVPFFEGYEQDEIQSVKPLFKKRKYSRGTLLFMEGDAGEECYVIETGLVKIYRIDESREITLALLDDGDYFGEMAMMQKGLTRSATAEVVEPSVIYSLNRRDFVHFMETNPKMCLKLLEETMERLRKANDQIYDLTFLDLKSRLVKAIIRLADEKGIEVEGGTQIPFKLTHQQLANMVGSIRESVSKLLQELQDEKIVTIKNKLITLHRQNL